MPLRAAAAVVALALFPGAANAGVASRTFSFAGAEQVFPEATLTQIPGPAAAIGVSVNPRSIKADGSSTATLTATVIDAHANAKPGENVSLSSSDPAACSWRSARRRSRQTASRPPRWSP